MIIEKLINHDGLTTNEKEIANYILSHISELSELSLRELADCIYVSPPTITRFCKKIGAKNYMSFKVKILEEYAYRNKIIKTIDDDFPFCSDDEEADVVSNLAELNIKAIEKARDNFDFEVANQVVKEIIKTKFIDIYASGMSQKVAGSFVEKMNRIGYPTTAFQDSSLMTYRSAASTDKQFAILISYSGLTRNVTKCLDALSKRKTKTLLITGNRLSPLVRKADYVYFMDLGEDIMMRNKIDAFSELIMLHYILDCIYALLFVRNYESNIKRTQETKSKQYIELCNK